MSGRSDEQVALVEAYTKAQGLFRTDATPDPVFTDTLELDLSTVVPSMAGPKRPQDRVPLSQSTAMYREALAAQMATQAATKPVHAKKHHKKPATQVKEDAQVDAPMAPMAPTTSTK